MEKLSSILAVMTDVAASEVLLGKAATLARRFGARLDLLLTDPASVCTFAIRCRQLGCDDRVSYVLHGSGEPVAAVILRRLREQPADLVMKHPARLHSLRRLPGAAGDAPLAAVAPVPVMLVGERPWSLTPRVAAAVDVSDPDGAALARGIVHAAGLFAMGCEAALDVLYSEREQQDERVRMERAVSLARLVREFRVGCEQLRMVDGAPEETLPPVLATGRYDLLVVGALPREPSSIPWLATLTSRLVDATAGDVLLVKATQRAAHDVAARDAARTGGLAVHP